MELHTRHAHLYTNDHIRGIISIENMQDGTVHLVASEDVAKDIAAIRFRLDLGIYTHAPLQEAYEQEGLEIFSMDVLRIAEEGENLAGLLLEQKKTLVELGKHFY